MQFSVQKLRNFYTKYERFLIPGALIVGIIADFITFRAINIETAFILLTIHSFLAGTAILFLNVYKPVQNRVLRVEEGSEQPRFIRYALIVTPLILQFSFGALLSASLVFYWFSGAFAVSWPLFAILLVMMISNDVFREYYQHPKVQVPIYYFALFSFSSVALPYLTNSIEPWSFVLAGLISLLVIAAYLFLTSQVLPTFKRNLRFFGISIMTVYVSMNLLYFFNLIPPIPLSMTDAGVYQDVELVGDDYIVTRNKQSLFEELLPGTTISIPESGSVYLFTSIFAPTDLNTVIVHDWEFKDPVTNKWRNSSDIPFNVVGGRSDGYRGYTFKNVHQEGKWRVTVKTQRKQVLGRLVFNVKYAENLELTEETK